MTGCSKNTQWKREGPPPWPLTYGFLTLKGFCYWLAAPLIREANLLTYVTSVLLKRLTAKHIKNSATSSLFKIEWGGG